MKKLIALSLSLLMVFAVVPMTMISASAETYDYYSIFSADTDELPILYSPTGHCKYEIVDDTVRSDGGKIVKVTKNGMYSNEPNVAFKQDFSELAKDSVGIRVFLAKSEDATAGKLVSFAFGSTVTDKTYIDTGIWGTANSGNCTTEGSWYEFYWDNTTGLSTATVYDNTASNNGYRVVPSSQTISTDNKIDADFISGMDSVYIRWNLNATTGHYAPNYYFFDDVQFIYPEGKAPGASTTLTTTAVETQDAASIRLGDVNGIRFYTTVDEDALATLTDGADYEIGTIIAPANLLGDDGELTKDDDCQIIPFKARTADGNIEYFNAANKEIAGSLVSIKDSNITRDFMARAYVKVGETYYYSTTTSTRSLQYVANAYKENNYNGDDLSEIVKKAVDNWAEGKTATAE